ncbi:uncharacterized protein LOC126838350 [Adelges cooleyi]|uniref:uncharacterized protein LOC126838350 n=1 Tax=Adelges cooleyi TaxID=133065 RepID=UPI00217F7D0B|nr:uncharacterized protein LOC126838350 [Adelges cooleyi]
MSIINAETFVQNQSTQPCSSIVNQNPVQIFDSNLIGPLNDPEYLIENAHCFQYIHDINKSNESKLQTKQNYQLTNQFLFGCNMPPHYSVLSISLMDKYVRYLKKPTELASKAFKSYKEIIDHEQELFISWLSEKWEERLKYRRLDIKPNVDEYVASACKFINNYIKTHYHGTYRSKMKIDFNRDDEMLDKVEMTLCEHIKTADTKYMAFIPIVDITKESSKISFTNGIYCPSPKLPLIKDEVCCRLSKEHCTDINICLSSLKHIMNLEKPNSLWLIPVNIQKDSDKKLYIGGALSTGHYSQQEKLCYYLRKELKKTFRKVIPGSESVMDKCEYNYDKWILQSCKNDNKQLYSLLIRSKPHVQIVLPNNERTEKVLTPKVEYQPEFGFEKVTEEQLAEYWMDTYFRTPKSKLTLVSVQYNMDLMMIKERQADKICTKIDEKKQSYLLRLLLMFEKLKQLDEGDYVLLHNPKKPFQIEIYQSSPYGGFNLLNMYFVLQQSEVPDSLTWVPIDNNIICPIHEHFKIAPCMFRPNPTPLKIEAITDQVTKLKAIMEHKEKLIKEQLAHKKKMKKERSKARKKLEKENDNETYNIESSE